MAAIGYSWASCIGSARFCAGLHSTSGRLFCDLPLKGEPPAGALQLGDARLLRLAEGFGSEDLVGVGQEMDSAAGQSIVLELMFATRLGHGLGTTQQLQDDLSF